MRLTVPDIEKDPDTVPERLCVRVRLGDALALGQGEAEGLREGEGVPVPLSEAVGEVDGQRVTDTEAVSLLVNGRVVPTAVEVKDGSLVREPIEKLAFDEELGEGESVLVTLADLVTLTDEVGEDDKQSVTVPEDVMDVVEVMLGERDPEGLIEDDGEIVETPLAVKVVLPLRVALGERETLIVGQLVAVPDEDRHRVDV